MEASHQVLTLATSYPEKEPQYALKEAQWTAKLVCCGEEKNHIPSGN
jgi:hypothetical protein